MSRLDNNTSDLTKHWNPDGVPKRPKRHEPVDLVEEQKKWTELLKPTPIQPEPKEGTVDAKTSE